jgi:hypothetical protein
MIYPVPVVSGRKYLIECIDEEEAIRLAKDLISGQVPDPMAQPDIYEYPEIHSDGVTQIFRLK